MRSGSSATLDRRFAVSGLAILPSLLLLCAAGLVLFAAPARAQNQVVQPPGGTTIGDAKSIPAATRTVPSREAAALIGRLSQPQATAMLRGMTAFDAAAVMRNMPASQAAQLLGGLPLSQATDIAGRLGQLSPSAANALRNALPARSALRNALGSAGGLASALGGATTGAGAYYVDMDNTYKNTELMCDLKTVYPSCPSQPMPMKDTPRKSFIKDFSPYLYAYARDAKDPTRPYSGTYYRGTPGEEMRTFQLFGRPEKGERGTDACVPQIKFSNPGDPSKITAEEEAKMVRLELDNCTNQFMLYSALYPFQKEGNDPKGPPLLSGEDPNDASKRISLATHCQPLRTVPENKNEYFASDYLKAAWIKLLKDPTHRKNPRAANEPHLPDGVQIQNPIEPPSPFPDVRLSAIASVPYEEINDPSHPFSPRWDYEFNERDHYSPMTASYGGDPKNSVFCAGDKDSQIVKVDILAFREANLKFDDKITDRIDFNKNCKANTGMQAYPCCIPTGPAGQMCKPIPCAQCYGMTAEAPVCATNYLGSPDRKKVKPTYLPVAPVLRFPGMASNMAGMSMMALDKATGGALSVGQARALLSSQLSVLTGLPASFSISQALPALNARIQLLAALPRLPTQAINKALASQSALINAASCKMSVGQLTSKLTGHSSIIRAAGSMTGMPLNHVLGAMESPGRLLSSMMAQTPLGDARVFMAEHVRMASDIAREAQTVGQAANKIGHRVDQLSQYNSEMTMEEARRQGMNTAGFEQVPRGMTVGQMRSILNAHGAGLQNYELTASMKDYASALSSTMGEISKLSNSTVGEAAEVLRGAQGTLRTLGTGNGLLDAAGLRDVSSVLSSQAHAVRQLAAGLDSTNLCAALGINGSLIDSFGGMENIQKLTNALNSQMSAMMKLSGSINLGQLTARLDSQLAALSKYADKLSLNSVADKIDKEISGKINDLAGKLGGNLAGQILPTAQVLAALPSMGPNPRTAKCNPNEFGLPNDVKMASLCRDLRAPYANLNKLKMRYHNPDEPNSVTMKEGAPEGYTFKEYFENRMPYPKLWDTGRSIQKTESDQQMPKDEMGQYTTIVGIGHEGDPGQQSSSGGSDRQSQAGALKKQDQRCLYGGWGGNVSMGGASITLPDPIASWTELKLYQARTRNELGISCLARYEKWFKGGSAENMALGGSGAVFPHGIVSIPDGKGNVIEKDLDEYQASPTSHEDKHTSSFKNEAWPWDWRGYMSSVKDEWRFPNFPTEAGNIITGLDNAQVGDIILMPRGLAKAEEKPGLPKLARVERVNLPGSSDCASRKPANCFLYVKESDNGKWPDVCGTTDMFRQVKERTIYKPGMLPQNARDEYQRIHATGDCSDSHLAECEAGAWNELKLYRMRKDTPSGGGTP